MKTQLKTKNHMESLKSNVLFKIGMIVVLIIVLMIPTVTVQNLIKERSETQLSAIDEVSEKWAKGQHIVGPYISIPFDVERKTVDVNGKEITEIETKQLYFLPENLNIESKVDPQRRHRGIFDVVVYQSMIRMKGEFTAFDCAQHNININRVHFNRATLNIGVTDLKGIEQQVKLNWNGKESLFTPGSATLNLVKTGIQAPITISDLDTDTYSFDLSLDLKGSQYLYFSPVGKTTDVNLTSNWQTPSFTGLFLPDNHTINSNGFDAHWNILNLNRNFPQSWIGKQHDLSESAFGTDLILPVDNYKKTDRVVKYAILFLALTFTVFFFVEIMNHIFIHPMHYLLVGLALVIFFTLLLSFSEHLMFNTSYLLASVLTLSLIGGYTYGIMKSWRLSGLILGILTILYLFIFIIIQMEDFALLIGSIGMFLVLALVMYFSRKIDWYNLRIGQ